MAVVVQKYGGSSVADVARIRSVADRVARTREAGHGVVVVVSAMGDTTDDLLRLAKEVTPHPERRELDMLLSAGERIAMALLSMALNDRGIPAVSFTGSQSGIITNDDHTNARIVEVRPYRVQDELARGKVVIVAGYQGVSYRKEITTLGRGGSDTTAVALAAALDAASCEIYSDVEGIFTADPRIVPSARRLSEISYEEMQELAESGARVLNAQAVEFAKDRGIAIYARHSAGGAETVVRRFPPRTPGRVIGVTSQTGLVRLRVDGGLGTATDLLAILEAAGTFGKQFLFDGAQTASLVISLENLHGFGRLREALLAGLPGRVFLDEEVGAVSAIGAGINATPAPLRSALLALSSAGIVPLGVSTSSFRISFLLKEVEVRPAVELVHARLVEAAVGQLVDSTQGGA